MFAKIRNRNDVSMHLYDMNSNRWHELQLSSPNQVPCQAMSSDGGLLCVISRHALTMPVRIVVCNPLTRAWRELPTHALSTIQPNMVQLVTNPGTKSYTVMVAARGDNFNHAMIYDSATGFCSCTNLFSDLVYGYRHSWAEENSGEGELLSQIDVYGPSVYDCRRGKLLPLGHPGDGLQRYALVKDHLFVLQDTIVQNACGRFRHRVLSEYQACKGDRSDWVLLRVHELPSAFTQCSNYEMLLFACGGFLLVSTDNDLDTKEWYEPVAPPERFFIELIR